MKRSAFFGGLVLLAGAGACGSSQTVDVRASAEPKACEFDKSTVKGAWVDIGPLNAIDTVAADALITARVVGHDPICFPRIYAGKFIRFCTLEVVHVYAGTDLKPGQHLTALCSKEFPDDIDIPDFAKRLPDAGLPAEPAPIGSTMDVVLAHMSGGPAEDAKILGDSTYGARLVALDAKAGTVSYLPGTWAEPGAEKPVPIDGLTDAWAKARELADAALV